MFGNFPNQLWNLTPSILAACIVQGGDIAMRLIVVFALLHMSVVAPLYALFKDA